MGDIDDPSTVIVIGNPGAGILSHQFLKKGAKQLVLFEPNTKIRTHLEVYLLLLLSLELCFIISIANYRAFTKIILCTSLPKCCSVQLGILKTPSTPYSPY